MPKKRDADENYGKAVNMTVGCIGGACTLTGFCIQKLWNPDVGTIILSVGASVVATALVTWINAKYILKTQRMEGLISIWRLHDLYESKAEMNNLDANEALKQCSHSIDIVAEGLSNYIAVKGDLLKEKILENGVKVRIISCDSVEMLTMRAEDEIGPGCSGSDAVHKVKNLTRWVENVRNALENGGKDKDNLQIRYHKTYPGFSYLRIDAMSFVSANLWGKPSQQCFAMSFDGDGKGDKYFRKYFESLWDNRDFVHNTCALNSIPPH